MKRRIFVGAGAAALAAAPVWAQIKIGGDVRSPEEFKAAIVADCKKWAAVIQEAGVRADERHLLLLSS